MTLASSPITVYSTRAEFNAAFDTNTVATPCVVCYPQPAGPRWCCAGCDERQEATTWRFYPTLMSQALCPHCAEGVAL